MTKQTRSIILHTCEAVIVFAFAAAVMYVFPEHATAAGLIAFTALSSMAKYMRVSDSIPVDDYVNKF